MNILVDRLPTSVMIDGRQTPINYDFRACLLIIMAFQDDDLTTREKQAIMLRLLYPEMPGNLPEAFRIGVKFLNGGSNEGETGGGSDGHRLYLFAKDGNAIFAAFRQTHGIDLETADLHWWKFMALFMDLSQDTFFCNLVGLRKRLKTGKATKEDRAAAAALGEMVYIPDADTRSPDEKAFEDEFYRLVEEGNKRRINGTTI